MVSGGEVDALENYLFKIDRLQISKFSPKCFTEHGFRRGGGCA